MAAVVHLVSAVDVDVHGAPGEVAQKLFGRRVDVVQLSAAEDGSELWVNPAHVTHVSAVVPAPSA